MNGHIEHVYKNIRYKLLQVNGKKYIFDLDESLWTFIFPFAQWFLPHRVYDIDEEMYKKLKKPIQGRKMLGPYFILSIGVAIVLANIISPYISNFDKNASTTLDVIMLILLIVCLGIYRLYIHKIRRRELSGIVNLNQLHKTTVKYRPQTMKEYGAFLFAFLFMWVFTLVMIYAFLLHGNGIIMLICLVLLLIISFLNTLAISVGKGKITFIKKQ